ncbi:MAG: hypothetical protein M3Y75_00910 [Actinomycetota bacterium]|nr:hypothetical protein [Actinomycetota bacterium]
MKHLKMIATVAMTAMAAFAFVGAGSAAATTLEVEGVTQNKLVIISGSMMAGTSGILGRTDGSFANTCTTLAIEGSTVSPFTGATVTGSATTFGFSNCERPIMTHKAGVIHGTHIAGTTNATVVSSGAEVTTGSPFGTLNCKTGAGVHIGTLTGTAAGHATLHVNAVLNCGFLVPSATLKGIGTVTSPTGLGVSA